MNTVFEIRSALQWSQSKLADNVLIRVKDEGKGIDIGKLSKLFDRFETFGSQCYHKNSKIEQQQ